jgi:hypothetical protein
MYILWDVTQRDTGKKVIQPGPDRHETGSIQMPSPLEDGDHDGRIDRRSRRTFVLGVGVGAAAVLSGCLADDGPGDGTTDDQSDDTPTPQPDAGTTTVPDDGDNGDEDSGSLSRAAARDLLPMESLAFRYEPPHGSQFGEFWVAVVGETDAAAVRAEAESGGHNEVDPQNGAVDGYLGVPVQVDPDGDEVTVFAVSGNGARGPVTTRPVPTDDLTAEEAEQAVPSEALSFTYEPPGAGEYGSLTIEVTEDTSVETLLARPQEAPSLFADRVGNLADEERVGAGTTLDVAVDPDGDEVIVWASVDGATGEVTRWNGPD